MENATDLVPGYRPDRVLTIHHALVPFVNGVDFNTPIESCSDHGPHGRVHSLGIAPAGKNTNPFHK